MYTLGSTVEWQAELARHLTCTPQDSVDQHAIFAIGRLWMASLRTLKLQSRIGRQHARARRSAAAAAYAGRVRRN